MVAIVTKYHGPTDHRGSRVRASANGLSVTLPWDCSTDSYENHQRAAFMLASRLDWTGRMISGETDHGYVWVFDQEG